MGPTKQTKNTKREVFTDTKTGRRFKKDKRGRRRFLCPHDRQPGSCNKGECVKNMRGPTKCNSKCPCGSGVQFRWCTKCNIEGAGAMYCKDTGKQKPRCPCGATSCGSSFCTHGRMWGQCSSCSPAEYVIAMTRARVRNSLKAKKTMATIDYLGIRGDLYKIYLEDTFQPSMNWENHNSLWQIGHRIPIKYNNPTDEDMCSRLHYTNTFAQYKDDNTHQSNKFIFKKY